MRDFLEDAVKETVQISLGYCQEKTFDEFKQALWRDFEGILESDAFTLNPWWNFQKTFLQKSLEEFLEESLR